jgi:RNA polymerase sigma-70 factor (ECF subfamily)
MMPLQDPPPDSPAGDAPPAPTRRPGAAVPGPARIPTSAMAAGSPPAPDRAHDVILSLLEAHGPEIYRHLRRLSPTAEDAADLHQETFLRAFRALPSLPAGANHRAWLHRIAANAAADANRRRTVRDATRLTRTAAVPEIAGTGVTSAVRRSRGSSTDDDVRAADGGPVADQATDPAARAEVAELRSAVRTALAALPWRERTAVIARVLDECDYPDVAAALDCSEANARQLVSRGIRRVRTGLATYLEIDR